VTSPSSEIEKRTGAVATPGGKEPFRNPSYPVRDHFSERAKLEDALRIATERVEAARGKLEAGGGAARTAEAVRLYHQLLGAHDQIAECARRMPLETGGLYVEDQERFTQATAALDRTWHRWEQPRP
jgi:hypothetical protein